MNSRWKRLFADRLWRYVLALFIVSVILIISGVMSAKAGMFDNYEVNDGNDLVTEVTQKKFTGTSNSGAARYATVEWYMITNEDYHNEQKSLEYLENWDKSVFDKVGILIDFTTVSSTGVDANYMYTQTRKADAETLIGALLEKYDTLEEREKLFSPIEVFFAPKIQCTLYNMNEVVVKQKIVYSYREFVNFLANDGLSWSEGAISAIEEMYSTSIVLNFNYTGFSIKVVDEETGEVPEKYTGGYSAEDALNGHVLYGETIQGIRSPGKLNGYEYAGYEWQDESGTILGNGMGSTITKYTVKKGTNGLVLVFKYRKLEPTPIPFITPPGGTPEITPEITPVITLPATPTPTQILVPTEDRNIQFSYVHYFTTDAGYWIGMIANSSTYSIANENSATGGGMVKSSSYTSRANSYMVGKDAVGNTWYFIPEGTDATYVHPANYNGYDVESVNVKYITELVFPSTITYNGTEYTVRSIGGGTSKYKTVQSDSSSSYSSTTGYGYSTSYSYGIVSGSHTYSRDSGSGNTYTSYEGRNIRYSYGVLGNGTIISDGERTKLYTATNAVESRWYDNDYYVYNTTLRKITIPDTVTEILPYAFAYCQALEEMEGGEGVHSIGSNAFSVEDHPEQLLRISSEWKDGSYKCENYSYYNEAYSMSYYTPVMVAWRNSSYLSTYMKFPYLPVLGTIGIEAFAGHYNISEVDLSETVTGIYNGAFLDCKLDHIRIPNLSAAIGIYASEDSLKEVLGTKGKVEEPTGIHTVAESTAMKYGMKFDGYYRVYCGHEVTYEPNGAPGEAVGMFSALNIDYLETEEFYSYQNFSQRYYNSVTYSPDEDYRYKFHVDAEGNVWSIDTEENKATRILVGTRFREVIDVGNGTAYYAWDMNGNLWFSGQVEGTSREDDGDLYSTYTKLYDWKKVTLPENMVEVRYTTRGVYVLDADGMLWRLYTSNGASSLQNKSGPALKSFYVLPYQEDIYICGTDADGTVWKKDVSNGTWQVYTNSLKARGVYLEEYNNYVYVTVIGEDGNLYTKGFSYGNVNFTTPSYVGGNFVNAELATAVRNGSTSGYEYVTLLHDVSGGTWMSMCYYNGSVKPGAVRLTSSSSVGVKRLFYVTANYGEYGETNDYGHTIYVERIYAWMENGYLYGIENNRDWCGGWKLADNSFQYVITSTDNIYAIAQNGTLWSAGENKYGQLGHGRNYAYNYPSSETSRYLNQAGTGTYTDIYASYSYTLAVGTDKKIYFTGDASNYSGMASGKTYCGFVLREKEKEWPGKERVLKTIRGYDYSTGIAQNIFTYEGFDFTGWNTKADGSGTEYYQGDNVELSGPLTLYAQWKSGSNIIRYDSNGGSGTMSDTMVDVSVTTAMLQKNMFFKTGHRFVGWNTKPDGSGTAYEDESVVGYFSGLLVLYAQWEEVVTSYTLVYMTYPFGSAVNAMWKYRVLTYNRETTVYGAPYTSSGYTVSYDNNKTADMSTIPKPLVLTEANTKTKAPAFDRWRMYQKNDRGILTYQGRAFTEGQILSRLSKTDGDVVYLYPSWEGSGGSVLLPVSECEGYGLVGWSDAATGSGTIYYADQESEEGGIYTPAKNTTLYAVWKPDTKEVVLNADLNGTSPEKHPQTEVLLTYDRYAPDVLLPTKEHYICFGYYTEPEGKGIQLIDKAGKGTIQTNNANGCFDEIDILYAYWVPEYFDVILDDRGATSTNHTKKIQVMLQEFGPEITIPTKIGYSFQGYFTEVRGNGTQYYDAEGNCVKVWAEETNRLLYAYWVQDEIKLPETENIVYPTPLPEKIIEGKIGREDAKALIYADDYNTATNALTDLQPYLVYDTIASDGAIPGTEKVAVRAKVGSWMLMYRLKRYSGSDNVRVYVTVPYRTQYENENEELIISERQTATYSFIVPKLWSYWKVEESGMYYPQQLIITNEALQEKSVVVNLNPVVSDAANLPSYHVISHGEKEKHVLWEAYDKDGMPMLTITLEEEQYIISDRVNTPPEVLDYLKVICGNVARTDTRHAMVRSDRFEFGDEVIVSDVWESTGNGAALDETKLPHSAQLVAFTSYQQLYQSDIALDKYMENGRYDSNAVIIYKGNESNIGTEDVLKVELTDINNINIHTPVACKGVFAEGIEKNVLTLDETLNFFTLKIENKGTHLSQIGYGTKNYLYALSGNSNVAEKEGLYLNQVRFPFPVYLDTGNDSDVTGRLDGDILVEAENWITIGDKLQQFYIPVSQKNGSYDIEFRTIAVNCPVGEEGQYEMHGRTQAFVNIDKANYVATDVLTLEVKSYLEDFLITDTDDSQALQELNNGNQALVLKKGYGFSYSVLTKGEFFEEAAEIRITPSYYWVSEDEKERVPVKLYFAEFVLDNKGKEFRELNTELTMELSDRIQQIWNGSCFVPSGVICVEQTELFEEYAKQQTITGREEFIKNSGYLVISFQIEVKSNKGMWYTFSDWERTELAEDMVAAGWSYVPGDVIRYDLSKNIEQDYEVGGVE